MVVLKIPIPIKVIMDEFLSGVCESETRGNMDCLLMLNETFSFVSISVLQSDTDLCYLTIFTNSCSFLNVKYFVNK